MFEIARNLIAKYRINPFKLRKYYKKKEDIVDEMGDILGEQGLINLIYEYKGKESYIAPEQDIRKHLIMKRFYDTQEDIYENELYSHNSFLSHIHVRDEGRTKLIMACYIGDENDIDTLWDELKFIRDTDGNSYRPIFIMGKQEFIKQCIKTDYNGLTSVVVLHVYFEKNKDICYYHF